MKQIITLLILLATTMYSFAQLPKDETTGKVVYTEVVELSGMEKQEIYDKAKLWVVSTLKSGDNMVELEGSNSDQIVGTGNLVLDSIIMNPKFPKSILPDVTLNFKFLIFCKDKRFKYSVENFLLTTVYGGHYYKSSLENLVPPAPFGLKGNNALAWNELTADYIDGQVRALIAEFIKQMETENDNDW